MALDIPDGFANVLFTINNGQGGQSAKSTISLGLELSFALDQNNVSFIANVFRDSLAPLYDNVWIMGPTHINETVGLLEKAWDDSGTEAGTHSAQVYTSPAVAHVVSKQTGLAGRKHRGRFYLPGVGETDVDESGTLAGARVNEVNAACATLRTDLEALAAVEKVVLLHDVETPGAVVPDPILALTCRTIVGTMRPRQRR